MNEHNLFQPKYIVKYCLRLSRYTGKVLVSQIVTGCFLLYLMILPLLAVSQVTLSLNSQVTCQSADVSIPLTVTGFNDIGAFTLFINCDTTDAKFIALENTDALLAGGSVVCAFVSNPQPGISISWARVTPVNMANGKLFDLRFKLIDSSAFFAFAPSCELALSDMSVVQNVKYNDGYIIYLNKLHEQPQSLKVGELKDAIFAVSQYTGVAYQWQRYENDGWVNLSDLPPYSGVFSSEMTVHSVPYSMNNFRYRCKLSLGDCFYFSDEALLQVSALSVPGYGSKASFLMDVFPNPSHGKLHVIINNSIENAVFQLVDLKGSILWHSLPQDFKPGEAIDIDLSSVQAGIYILKVFDHRFNKIEARNIEVL